MKYRDDETHRTDTFAQYDPSNVQECQKHDWTSVESYW